MAKLNHLKLLSRRPDRLVIGIRPLEARVLLLRVLSGMSLIAIGIYWWPQSKVISLGLGLVGSVLALPQNPTETLILSKPHDQVLLLHHRFFLPKVKASCALSEVTDVQVSREAVDRYAEDQTLYRCQVLLILKSGEHLMVGDYVSQSARGDSSPREMAQKMVKWIRTFLRD